MNILKGILSESSKYYIDSKRKIESKILELPQGSLKERKISGRKYYYLQSRVGEKIMQKYLGKDKPDNLIKQSAQRKALKSELKKVDQAIQVLKRVQGRKRG